MRVRPGDVRTQARAGWRHAVRHRRLLHQRRPVRVSDGTRRSIARLMNRRRRGRSNGVDESTAAVLRFSGGRVASFVTSFNAADVAEYRVVGTKGQLHVDPAYEYAEGLAYSLTRQRQGDAQAARQARSVRARAAALLGLHPTEPEAGTVGRGRPPGRAHRAGPLRIGPRRTYQCRCRPTATRNGRRGASAIARPGIRKPRLVKVKSPTL